MVPAAFLHNSHPAIPTTDAATQIDTKIHE